MACLHCGGVIEPEEKATLNRAGRWLHEGAGGELVPLGDKVRKTATVSYRLQGPVAAFATWSQLVSRYLGAMETFEATGDESGLKTVVNVDLGRPFASRAKGGTALSEVALREGASDRAWRVAPMGTRFLTAAVDVQVGRFVVQVEAWAEGLERTVIGRFDIHAPPEGAPRAGERQIDPARFGEDWQALFALADLSYPVAGAEHSLRVLSVVIDAGGAPGVTPNAYAFYRRARRSHPRRFHLVRGRGGERVKRAEVSTPETAHKGKKHVARDVRIIWAATDRLKDEVAASLLREQEGTRALRVPRARPRKCSRSMRPRSEPTRDGRRKRTSGVTRRLTSQSTPWPWSLSSVSRG